MKRGAPPFPNRLTAALVVAVLLLGARAGAVVVDGIAAVVNGEIITLLELEKAGRTAVEQRLRAAPSGEQDRLRREVLRPILDELVLERLQAQRARQLGIQVSSQDVEAAVGKIQAENNLSAEMFERFLKERGISRDDYLREIRIQIRLSRLVQQEIRSRLTVSEAEAEAYFQQHRGDWSRPEKIRMRHLLVPVSEGAPPEAVEGARQKALGIVAEARQGRDFAQLARREASGSGDGDPAVEFARGELTPELEAAAFALPEGGVSEPLRSAGGFLVLQLVAKTPAYQPTFAEIRSSIEQKLVEQKTRARYDEWLKQLRTDAIVDIKY